MVKKIMVLVMLSSFLCGCGSFASRFEGGYHDEYYSGVKYSVHQADRGYGFYYLDVPFSFIFDTVMLPADIIRIESTH
ncbi:YceK/YidQ family lipoprotein [Budviciaceae bacterium CWB-B4]|uniref:YceK/YidQ family lipoprotein n=1 Tax=Limnobaculum xujianqingii TaxID=2738837 RepID=A0A9D7AGS3_9GAMM|nr:YceK/YidQ family lipoprotein [Limnobaculum xujianqingii]MBK5072380.1 YceK/YidQ family lipoprotein [Limnobaculum xujianqingii]MBK5175689.1 YceK/YidQ family lipoprotein [Limnobaculum xujianqingii]